MKGKAVKKKETGKKVAVVKEPPPPALSSGPKGMIELAISKGADLDKLEKLLTLQERWDANEAKKAFNSCMVEVHKNIPMIGKSLKNEQTHSKYASLDNIIFETKAIYTEQGFSISFHEGVTEKPEHIRVCADVTHRLGHKEPYFYDVPMDGKGLKGNANMTPIHAKASSTSYGRRYLMCMIWNIPTGDDNDGNNGSAAPRKQPASMPKEREDTRKNAAEGEVVEPGEDLVVDNQGVISKQLAADLVKLAQKNGYKQAEVYEIITKLNYAKVIDILKQDYVTVVKELEVKAEVWRKNKEAIQKEAWDGS